MSTEIRKEEVLAELSNQLDGRTKELNQYMLDLTYSLTSESKSTAGDKHDTGRAMIHLEQEKLQHQLQEVQLQLQRIRALQHSEKLTGVVGFGSFIKAGQFYFLIGIGLGKQLVNGHVIYCVGLETPVGKILRGKKQGDTFPFGGGMLVIEYLD